MAKIEMWEREATVTVWDTSALTENERAELLYHLNYLAKELPYRTGVIKADICFFNNTITLIIDNEDNRCNHELIKENAKMHNCEVVSIKDTVVFEVEEYEIKDGFNLSYDDCPDAFVLVK